jgi:hypothetical protein
MCQLVVNGLLSTTCVGWFKPPTIKHPPRFGQLPNLAVPDTVDDPLPDTEIDTWEGNEPS